MRTWHRFGGPRLAHMRFIQKNIFLYFFLLMLGASGFFIALVWPQAESFYAFIVFAAAGGLGVAIYIYSTKRDHKQLVCPVGSNCNVVVNSRYAKFLGIPLEYWGMFYYIVTAFSYTTFIIAPDLLPKLFVSGIVLLSTSAFLFSLYLLFVQAFLLRQWCIWCLLSASLTTLIFVVALSSVDFAVELLAGATLATDAMRALGFALGLGGSTAAMLLFTRFLSDYKINENEAQTLKSFSELIWLGLGLVLVSHFASFVGNTETLAHSGAFLVQSIALFAVTLAGAVLLIIFSPFLTAIPFREPEANVTPSTLKSLRRPMLLTGAVALASWYFALLLDHLPRYESPILILLYAAALTAAIAVALFWESAISEKANRD